MSMEIIRFVARCPDCGLDAQWVGAPTQQAGTSYTIKCPSNNPPSPNGGRDDEVAQAEG